jgi:hypothetical protein
MQERPRAAEGFNVLRHLVIMTLKDGTTPAQIDNLARQFDEFSGIVDRRILHGQDVPLKPRPTNRPVYAVSVDFETPEQYLGFDEHPAHQPIRDALRPILESVIATDFEI